MIRFPVITYEAISKPAGLLKLLSYSSQCSCSIVVSLGVGVSSFSSTLSHWPSPIKMLFSTLYFSVVMRILFSVVCGSFFRGDHSPGWWKIWSLCLSGQMLLFTLPGSLLVQTCGSLLIFLGVFFMLLYSLLALTFAPEMFVSALIHDITTICFLDFLNILFHIFWSSMLSPDCSLTFFLLFSDLQYKCLPCTLKNFDFVILWHTCSNQFFFEDSYFIYMKSILLVIYIYHFLSNDFHDLFSYLLIFISFLIWKSVFYYVIDSFCDNCIFFPFL